MRIIKTIDDLPQEKREKIKAEEKEKKIRQKMQEILRKMAIKELKKEGKAVMLTTHYMHEAEMLCDNIALISRGKIVAIGSPSDLKNMLGEERVIEEVPILVTRNFPSSVLTGVTFTGIGFLPSGCWPVNPPNQK